LFRRYNLEREKRYGSATTNAYRDRKDAASKTCCAFDECFNALIIENTNL